MHVFLVVSNTLVALSVNKVSTNPKCSISSINTEPTYMLKMAPSVIFKRNF